MFKELFEMSIAQLGDWNFGQLSPITQFVVENKYTEISNKEIDSMVFQLKQLRNSLFFIVCKFNSKNENYDIYANMQLKKVNSPGFKQLGYTKLAAVETVAVADTNQGKGIAEWIYKVIVNKLKYQILGDKDQYFGARRLWSKLSNDNTIRVDLVNIKTMDVEKNLKLHQGKVDHDFDIRVWHFIENDMRTILTKM